MNSADVLQWLKSFITDESVVKAFEGNLLSLYSTENIYHSKRIQNTSEIINETCLSYLIL